jgi:hypothetical protein
LLERISTDDERGELGAAARSMLVFGFADPAHSDVRVSAVGMVADTYSTGPAESRALLKRLFGNEIDDYVAHEIPTLTRKIAIVADADAGFAGDIYRRVYEYEVRDKSATSLGDSRILGLRSNVRQDFEMSRFSLGEFAPTFLTKQTSAAIPAIVDAINRYITRTHSVTESEPEGTALVANRTIRLFRDFSHIWAYDPDSPHHQDGDVLIDALLNFLLSGSDDAVLDAAKLLAVHATYAVVWARMFMAAAKRGGALAAAVVLYAENEIFLMSADTRKDAIDLISVVARKKKKADRRRFEEAALGFDFTSFDRPEIAKEEILGRLFRTIGRKWIVTKEALQYIKDDPTTEDSNKRLYSVTSWRGTPDSYFGLKDVDPSDPPTSFLVSKIDAVRDLIKDGHGPASCEFEEGLASLVNLRNAMADTPHISPDLLRRAEGQLGRGEADQG